MKKIVNFDFIDLVPVPHGIIFTRNCVMPNGENKAVFNHLDIVTNEISVVTKGSYLLNKFGTYFDEISHQLTDCITCDTEKLSNGDVVILYPTGEMGYFETQGKLKWTGDIYYNDAPVRGLSKDNDAVWCCVPQRHAIIQYNFNLEKISMRIGGENNTSFKSPVSVCTYNGNLYVCDCDGCAIRMVDLNTYDVSTYLSFNEPCYNFFVVMDRFFVVLKSGLYEI